MFVDYSWKILSHSIIGLIGSKNYFRVYTTAMTAVQVCGYSPNVRSKLFISFCCISNKCNKKKFGKFNFINCYHYWEFFLYQNKWICRHFGGPKFKINSLTTNISLIEKLQLFHSAKKNALRAIKAETTNRSVLFSS